MKANDADLVRMCRQGDRGAFETLVDKYQKTVFNAAYRIVNNYDDARDVAQSAFMKAWANLDRYDPSHKFYSWLYRITVNEALNVAGRRPRNEPLGPSLPDHGPDALQIADRNDVGRRVHRALGTLKPEYRAVIVLRHFLDASYDEMAQTLGLPSKTVKSRLFTARRLLREELDREETLQ